MKPHSRCALTIPLLASLVFVSPAAAEVVRLRYAPQDAGATTVMKPADPGMPTGTRTSRLGLRREVYFCEPRYNYLGEYGHWHTGQRVTVPLSLPTDTPRVEQTWRGIIYNYGSYTVEVHFLRDGSVEVVYNSGLF